MGGALCEGPSMGWPLRQGSLLEIFGAETQGSRADLGKQRLKYWSVHMNLSKLDELRVQLQQFD